VKIIGLILALLLISFLAIGCASKATSPSSPVTIAVWPFEDFSLKPEQNSPLLSFVLTNSVIDMIQSNPALEAVERSRLESVLREQSLGSGVLTDESTRLRLGRILGAKWMLFGAWQALGEHVRIDVRVVDTESGRIMAAKDKNINKAIESQIESSTLSITHELLSNILKK
jgi:TolB-like protein